MTRMTGPDCVVMCNLINTYIHIHTYTHTYNMRRKTQIHDRARRGRKREAEEADTVEVADEVIVGSLRRFREALVGPPQGPQKRRHLRR